MKEIKLTKGKVAFVDDEDFEYLSQFSWYAQQNPNTFYARRDINLRSPQRQAVYMHKELTGSDLLSDHEDGNGLNNQKENLRRATPQQNTHNSKKPSHNTSGFKGVLRRKERKKWYARLVLGGTQISLGAFETPEEAAVAYDLGAIKYHGKFAKLNFPKGLNAP